MPNTVLVIDDNPGVGEALSLLLSLRDIKSLYAATPAEGLALLARQRVDLVIQDMNFSADTTSGEEGVALFRALRELQARRDALQHRFDWDGMVFQSEAMLSMLELAAQVARTELPVLITGPNGCGKERVAAIVHANSPRKDRPFVALNCGALPADLVEAELFGAESGAYTGATRAREGRFEAAHGGTLFLDEIGTMPLNSQVKLLRVLETGRYERLGSSKTRDAKVRVISATNADLRAMVAAGSFREDLYYRLNVFELRVPPLAQRRDDVLPLAAHFLGGSAEQLNDAARDALLALAWPGNVRELKNVMARAALLAGDGPITPQHLGLESPVAHASARNLDEPSREAVLAALTEAHGVVSRAAQALGLSRQALYRRMARYGVVDGTGH